MPEEGAFWNNWKNTALPASGSTVSNQNASGAYAGFKGGSNQTNVAVDPYIADILSMDPKQRLAISQLLKNAGYIRNATSKYNKDLGDAYSKAANEWAVEAARTGRPSLTLRDFLLENQQPTGTGAANIPSRSIYQYTPEQLGAKIDEVAANLLGRAITEADKSQKWYNDLNSTLNEMVSKGTVTTTQRVKNPKTGKLETVTIQKPEVTTEAIQSKISGALSEADPQALERKKRLDFTQWLFGNMSGGQ